MARHCKNLDCPALERDGLPAEYADTIEDCAECGLPLADGERPAPPAASYRELVTVYVARDSISAELIRGALEAEGIPAFLSGQHLAAAVGELPTSVLQISVQVEPPHAARARELALQIAN